MNVDGDEVCEVKEWLTVNNLTRRVNITRNRMVHILNSLGQKRKKNHPESSKSGRRKEEKQGCNDEPRKERKVKVKVGGIP